jgi:hypothetical protein
MGKSVAFTLDDDPALGAVADTIMEQSPDVQEHVVSEVPAEETPAAGSAPAVAAEVDKDGVSFDPLLHTGTKLKSGIWRKKKQTGSALAAPKKSKTAATAEVVTQAELDQKARAAGALAASSVFMCGRMFGGPEWGPIGMKNGEPSIEDYDEKKMMEQAFADYFIAKGVTEISPGWGIAMAMSAYVVPRLQMPQTQERVGKAKSWFTLRIAKWKVQRMLKKRGIAAVVTIEQNEVLIDGARLNQWNERKRKDDTSADAGA